MVTFMKRLAVFFLVAGVIGGIVLGVVLPTITVSQSSWKDSETSFNVVLFICSLLSSILLFALLYSFAELLEHAFIQVAGDKPLKEYVKDRKSVV